MMHCFRKNIGNSYRICKNVNKMHIRKRFISNSNIKALSKMHTKSIILIQLKLVNYFKAYLGKVSNNQIFVNVLNKEIATVLQKIQPSVYGNHLVRYFESLSAAIDKTKYRNPTQTTANVEEEKAVTQKWKKESFVVSKESINSRTQQIISLLALTHSDILKLKYIEEIISHIKQYPNSKHKAVNEGAIRLLINIRKKTTKCEIVGAANEALALLGYGGRVPRNGVRILSIDGGGTRGILVIEMLKKLEEHCGKPILEMFDMICGVSTGAIIASLLGIKQYNVNEVSDIYKNLSTQIFTQSTIKGTSNLVFSHSYYDTALWEKILKDNIGEKPLISTNRNEKCPKMCLISAVVNKSRLSAYLFRNYDLPFRIQSQYTGSHNHLVWEAVRASAAAPTYFEEFKLGSMLHQDGGILVNNPTAVAIHEARLLWPGTPIQCVVSCGTGRTAPMTSDLPPQSSLSWKDKFLAIIDSATDTEAVHTMLSDLLPPNVYYRFNPYLTEMLDIAEINPEKLRQLEMDAVMYIRRNEDKFKRAADALNKNKSLIKKFKDFIDDINDTTGFNLGVKFRSL